MAVEAQISCTLHNRTWSQAGTVSAPSCIYIYIDWPSPWSWDILSWPSAEQLSLVRVQFCDQHRWCTPWAEWLPWWCLHGSNAGTTPCHRQTSEEWPRTTRTVLDQGLSLWDRADDVHNRWGTTGVHDSVCPTGQIWTELHQSCSTQARWTAPISPVSMNMREGSPGCQQSIAVGRICGKGRFELQLRQTIDD